MALFTRGGPAQAVRGPEKNPLNLNRIGFNRGLRRKVIENRMLAFEIIPIAGMIFCFMEC